MLPSGTVTFLFTDIEGSTARWEADADRMRLALMAHNEILDGVAGEHLGCVFKTVGDAYCIAFASAEDAAAAATAVQTRLATASDPLAVRMALHTATVRPTGHDYFGPPLNRVARVLGVAYGGQILVTDATRSLLPPHLTLKDLGQHLLKDLREPTRLWQLGAGDFPPVQSLGAFKNNLPLQTTSFVGREEELRDLSGLLKKSRMVTLTGAGGTGKTRLSLQLAAEHADRFPDGVWFCELASVPEREDVLRVVAAAIRAPDLQGTVQDRIINHLTGKRCLVILDNCEHVLDVASQIAESLVGSCAEVTVLATSREPLGVRGETPYRVPSLPAPDPKRVHALTELEEFGSTALFIDRLEMAAPDYELHEREATVIAKICMRLDGIPLAIELAAARGRAMSLDQIEKRLDDRFRLLTGGNRNALSRQQTLRALIDWSVQLLSEPERQLFVALSVFSDGWRLEAAEAICADAQNGLEDWQILDLHTSMVDKSLVLYDRERDRYRMLESIRQYALERLEQEPGAADLRDRHARHYLESVSAVGSFLGASPEVFRNFAADYENFRSAVEWTTGSPEWRIPALRALAESYEGFYSMGRLREFLRLVTPVFEGIGDSNDEDLDSVLESARLCAFNARVVLGDTSAWQEAIAHRERLADPSHKFNAISCINIGYSMIQSHLYEECLAFVAEVYDRCEQSPDHFVLGFLQCYRGICYAMKGDLAESVPEFELAIRILDSAADHVGSLSNWGNLVIAWMAQGNVREAVRASLALNRKSSASRIQIWVRLAVLLTFAHLAMELNDVNLATTLYGGARRMEADSGFRPDAFDELGHLSVYSRLTSLRDEASLSELIERGKRLDWEPWLQALVTVTAEDVLEPELKFPHRNLIRV